MTDRGKVFVITGPSGVGKGTLIATLLEAVPELELSVSATTRTPRPGEVDGRDYHFLDSAEFERRVDGGDFLEHATYAGNRYGTLRSETEDEPVVLEIEVQGARQVREAMPDATQVFIAPPSTEELRSRLLARGTDSPDVIRKRLEVAEGELRAQEEFPHVIVNDDLDRAVRELVELVARIWARPQGEART